MMNRVTATELMTIGTFARTTGLTPGALRFYADSGLLGPADVDESTGYRYYSESQVHQAVRIRRLREIGMPLDNIAEVMAGDLTAIDRHVAQLAVDARQAQRIARQMTRKIEGRHHMIRFNGPVFAGAVDQILTATSHHPDMPVLGGVYVESGSGTMTLTATDRYRLSTRSVTVEGALDEWSGVLDGGDLRAAIPFVRAHDRIDLVVGPAAIDFCAESGSCLPCSVLAEDFPDYRAMLAGMPGAVTRVVVPRAPLMHALENQQNANLAVVAAQDALIVSNTRIPATVTGPCIEMAFSMTTLYPAIGSAIGPEVMIDISGPALPVVVRSADNGDLTTLAMPVEPSLVGG